jgi:cell division protein ZapA (FtsZ GTPase activity inhibitor)
MERVQVEIYGQTYSIKVGSDPAYTRELAAFVDGKMKEIEKGTGTVDPLRVAILTAITIADELNWERKQRRAVENTASGAVKRMLDITEPSPEVPSLPVT